ncbi:MAG: hypothetical protein HC778_08445 [Chamaesiphon sp. CSU_1_12]|nr:hypothetical protein [Chamaesiphon sp. CSU_1_12]
MKRRIEREVSSRLCASRQRRFYISCRRGYAYGRNLRIKKAVDLYFLTERLRQRSGFPT